MLHFIGISLCSKGKLGVNLLFMVHNVEVSCIFYTQQSLGGLQVASSTQTQYLV